MYTEKSLKLNSIQNSFWNETFVYNLFGKEFRTNLWQKNVQI